MSDYAILTNRKRAIIALIHSLVFLLIAIRGVVSPSKTVGLITAMQAHANMGNSAAMSEIFAAVTVTLVVLFAYSGCAREKLYFGLCATSAGTGLVRALVGDPPFHASQYIRVVMLLCAVAAGAMIWREYSEVELSSD